MTINSDTKSIANIDLYDAIDVPSQWLIDAFSAHREEGSVLVDGCKIQYYSWGDKNKPSVVMMHGFLSHSKCWAFIAPYLAADYRVVAFDFSGMGDSQWRADYSDRVRIKELMSVCNETGLLNHQTKPILIAHSYGGRIATAALHAHPNTFYGSIICDLMIIRPSVYENTPRQFQAPGKRTPHKANRIYPDYESARKRFLLAPPQKVEQTELLDFMAYHSLKQENGGWQWKFDPRLFIETEEMKNSYLKIGPDLVNAPGQKAFIYAANSPLFTQDSVNYITELMQELSQPRFPIIEIPESHHHLMLDQPIALISSLRSILGLWCNPE